MARRETFKQARRRLLDALRGAGWKTEPLAVTPSALAPNGSVKVYFKPQTVYAATSKPFTLRNAVVWGGDTRDLELANFEALQRDAAKGAKARVKTRPKNGNGNGRGRKLTNRQAAALAIIVGLKPSYRPEAFDWVSEKGMFLGEYDINNPVIAALVSKGYLKTNRAGSIIRLQAKRKRGPHTWREMGSGERLRFSLTPTQRAELVPYKGLWPLPNIPELEEYAAAGIVPPLDAPAKPKRAPAKPKRARAKKPKPPPKSGYVVERCELTRTRHESLAAARKAATGPRTVIRNRKNGRFERKGTS